MAFQLRVLIAIVHIQSKEGERRGREVYSLLGSNIQRHISVSLNTDGHGTNLTLYIFT